MTVAPNRREAIHWLRPELVTNPGVFEARKPSLVIACGRAVENWRTCTTEDVAKVTCSACSAIASPPRNPFAQLS